MENLYFRDNDPNEIYGGRDLLKLGKTAQSVAEQVRNNDFSDLYIGDYFLTTMNNRQIKWHIAHFNYFLYTGDTMFTKPHLILINNISILEASMNPTDTTDGGYIESAMRKNTFITILNYIKSTVLGDYILLHRDIFTAGINRNAVSGGCPAWTGCTDTYKWSDSTIELLTEPQIYGTTAYSSSAFDIGTGYAQFAIFKLNKKFININREWLWLRAVASNTLFCGVSSYGWASAEKASLKYGVRIYFCFG